MTLDLAEREVDVAERSVRFRVAGSGDPVVLVHGLAGSARWWRPVLPALVEHHTVHLVDLPGFGAMRGGPRLALEQAAEWLVAWRVAAGIPRASLVGHSMGAAVVVRAAARDPDGVHRLVLVAPAGLGRRSAAAHVLPLASELRRRGPRFMAVLATDVLRAGPRTMLRATLDVLSEDVRADLARVTAPTLAVLGARDSLIPLDVGAALARDLPGARVVVLDAAGHVPMFDDPANLAETILEFLASA